MLAALRRLWPPAPPAVPDPHPDFVLPPGDGWWPRVRMTAGCRDTDPIPKAADAGRVLDGPDGPVQVMHTGQRVAAGGYHGVWMAEIIRQLRGHHEPQEEWAFHRLLRHCRPGTAMLELGCFWAYYSLWFRAAVPGGRSLLVEPDPNNLAVGRRNFALNGLAGEFVQASVGPRPLPPRPFRCESDGVERPVPEVSVDALLAETGCDRLELLLADVQGAEAGLFDGMADALARRAVRFVVVSTHHHTISGSPHTHRDCLEAVRRRGGQVLVEHPVAESFSGDGLVVASFDPADRRLPPVRVSRNRPEDSLFGGR